MDAETKPVAPESARTLLTAQARNGALVTASSSGASAPARATRPGATAQPSAAVTATAQTVPPRRRARRPPARRPSRAPAAREPPAGPAAMAQASPDRPLTSCSTPWERIAGVVARLKRTKPFACGENHSP